MAVVCCWPNAVARSTSPGDELDEIGASLPPDCTTARGFLVNGLLGRFAEVVVARLPARCRSGIRDIRHPVRGYARRHADADAVHLGRDAGFQPTRPSISMRSPPSCA